MTEKEVIKSKISKKIQLQVFVDEYMDMKTLKQKKVSAKFIENMAKRLMYWAENDANALSLSEFYIGEGINYKDFTRWCESYTVLGSVHEHVKTIIGNRRIKGAINRKYDSGIIKYMQPFFDPQFKEMAMFWSSLSKSKDNISSQKDVVVVYMDKIEDSTGVVARQKE